MLNSGNSLNCLCNINPQVTLIEKSQRKKSQYLTTVVGDNINIMKTTFELNFDFYQALHSMDTQKYGNKKNLSF